MCCLVCILIPSLPLCTVSRSFKFRLSFCKGGASLFTCAHPGAYTLLLETFFSWSKNNLKLEKIQRALKAQTPSCYSLEPKSTRVRGCPSCWFQVDFGQVCILLLQSAQHTPVCRHSRTLSPTHLAGTSMCWWCPCLWGCVNASATERLLFPKKV